MSLSVKVARLGGGGGRVGGRPVAMMGDAGLFGFLGSAIKSVGKAALGGVTGLLTGGPVGAIGGALGGALGPVLKATPPMISTAGRGAAGGIVGGATAATIGAALGPGRGPGFNIPGTGVRVSPGDIFPGGADFLQRQAGSAGGCPSGHRPNKTAYFLKDGTFVPEGSRCVKIRRRNNLNPRALTKALGRVEGFKKQASRASRITVRKKKGCR